MTMIVNLQVTRIETIEIPDHIVQFLDFVTRSGNKRIINDFNDSAYPRIRIEETIKLISSIRTIFDIDSLRDARDMVHAWQQERGYRRDC